MNTKNKIDIQKQLSEFYSILDFKPLSANAISIYLVLLQIASKTDWLYEFKVTNTILMSKVKGLNISALQRARNELINNQYIFYKKGTNQNVASTYTINKLYNDEIIQFEQANEQADKQASEQANEQADEHIITKLNLLFNYIYKGGSGEKIGLTENDRNNLILIYSRLEMYVKDSNIYDLMPEERVLDEKIMFWAIKEIYLSPHKIYLNLLTRDKFILKYYKTKKYITEKENYKIKEIIDYFMVCLHDEMENTKLKPKPTEGRHLIRYKDEKDYDYYICDYCGDEIKILKKKIEMTGGIVVLPHSLTKRGEVKIVLCNKCINPVLKELEKK